VTIFLVFYKIIDFISKADLLIKERVNISL